MAFLSVSGTASSNGRAPIAPRWFSSPPVRKRLRSWPCQHATTTFWPETHWAGCTDWGRGVPVGLQEFYSLLVVAIFKGQGAHARGAEISHWCSRAERGTNAAIRWFSPVIFGGRSVPATAEVRHPASFCRPDPCLTVVYLPAHRRRVLRFLRGSSGWHVQPTGICVCSVAPAVSAYRYAYAWQVEQAMRCVVAMLDTACKLLNECTCARRTLPRSGAMPSGSPRDSISMKL